MKPSLYHFIRVYGKKYNKPGLTISEEALLKLQRNPWPGNVRELEHTVEKAVILAENELLGPDDFLSGSEEIYLYRSYGDIGRYGEEDDPEHAETKSYESKPYG